MSRIRLKCGIEITHEAIGKILDATLMLVEWNEHDLEPAPGLENLSETVFWPVVVNGIRMPSERIAFFRRIIDSENGEEGYAVESLADSFQIGNHVYYQNDFQILLLGTSRQESEEAVLNEIKRFFRMNIYE